MEELGTGPLDDAYLRLKAGLGNLEDVRKLLDEGLLSAVRRYGGHVRNSMEVARLTAKDAPWRAVSDEKWREICHSGDIGRFLDISVSVLELMLPTHNQQLDLAIRRISADGGWVFIRDAHRALPANISARITLPQRPRRLGPKPARELARHVAATTPASGRPATPGRERGTTPQRNGGSVPWANDLSDFSIVYLRPTGNAYHADPECPSMLNGQTWGKPGTIPEDGESVLRSQAERRGRTPCQRCYPRQWVDEGRDVSRS